MKIHGKDFQKYHKLSKNHFQQIYQVKSNYSVYFLI
jgi:phosphoserine aminotransferase